MEPGSGGPWTSADGHAGLAFYPAPTVMSFPPTIVCVELNDEVHVCPPEALVAPVLVSFLALFSDSSRRETQ